MDSWQTVVLNEDLNDVHKNRTCQFLFVVERTEISSRVLDKFYIGSKKNPLNDVKIVTYQDILQNVIKFSEHPLTSKKKSNQLYNLAAEEIVRHLDDNSLLPFKMMVSLIKLQVMYLIDKDVEDTQKQSMLERDLSNERAELLNPTEKRPKTFDLSNSLNALTFKNNTRFKYEKVDNPLLYDSIPVQSKELFFVIMGFYDFQLFTELFEVKVCCVAFVQVIDPGFDPSSVPVKGNASTAKGANKRVSNRTKALLKFWKIFYDNFEVEDYKKCFKNTFHMTICVPEFALEQLCVTTKLCLNVFDYISAELLQCVDVQRCYVNYIRNLRMCNVGPKPKFVPSRNYHFYNKILNLLPPECFNVPFFLYATLEQLGQLISPSETSRKASEVFLNYEILTKAMPKHKGLRGCIGDILNKSGSPLCYYDDGSPSKDHAGPKVNLKIARKRFLTHERDHNCIRVSPYDKIRSEYLRINGEILEKCRPFLLWKKCNSKQMHILQNRYNLKSLASVLEMSIQELQYSLHIVLFNSVKCARNAHPAGCSDSFNSLFPRFADEITNVIDLRPAKLSSIFPNVYDLRNMALFKWFDQLRSDVMLQDLANADQNYLCMDYRFNAFDDTILLRFHNNLDDFGINERVWNESLRTDLGIKEFCKYVIYDDCVWLEMQKEKFKQTREDEYNDCVLANQVEKRKLYPELVFTDYDFLQPGSFKAKAKLEEGKTITFPMTAPLATMEKLAQPVQLAPEKNLSIHFAESAFQFYAYDHCDHRSQLKGSTICFHSRDGVKVTVDQTRFLKSPKTLSINVTTHGHSLVLHKNDTTWSEPLTFHFSLANHTILAFAKPLKPIKPESKLCSRLTHAIKSADETDPRQKMYFVSESQSRVLKCFDVPMITKRNLILSHELLNPFLEEVNKRNIPIKYILSNETLSDKEIGEIEDKLISTSKFRNDPSRLRRRNSIRFITTANFESLPEDVNVEEQRCNKAHRAVSSEDVPLVRKSIKKLLKEVREATSAHLPIFKICSSKLHKNRYVKRVRSIVSVPEEAVIKRLVIKPRMRNAGSEVRITKVLPIKPLVERSYPMYNLKISLPSGLMLETLPGMNNMHFCIKQRYLDVGPRSVSIADESSRTFLRNGVLVIKTNDGNLKVLNVNGQIINCELPLIKEKGTKNEKPKRKLISHLTQLHAYGTNLTRFKRRMQKVVHRWEKRVETQRLPSYGRSLFKRLGKSQSGVYILQNSLKPFKKFSLITSDGKRISTVKTAIVEEQKFYSGSITDYRYEEVLFTRDDGTRSLLNREGLLITHFPDGTRISSWIYVEPELIYVVDEPKRCDITCDKQEQASLHSDFDSVSSIASKKKPLQADTGWVSIFLNFKFENPHYATVVYYGTDNCAEIFLPGSVNIKVTELGEYHVQLDENVSASVTCEKVLLESRLCHNCMETCTTNVNVKPYYDKAKDALHSSKEELLRVEDSFGKEFIVNYDGKCYKKQKHRTNGRNRAGCEHHYPFETQQLFVLTRSLSGCKFWDTNSYKNKLHYAQKDKNTVVRDSQEKQAPLVVIESCVDVPKDDEFILPYKEPMLTLTKQKVPKSEEVCYFYVKRLILRPLPNISTLLPFYQILQYKLSHDSNIVWSGASEFFIFYKDILKEFEMRRTSEKKAQLLAEAERLLVVEPAVPLVEKIKKWKQECAEKMIKIRQDAIPLYFESKLRDDAMKEEHVSEAASIVSVEFSPRESYEVPSRTYRDISLQSEEEMEESTSHVEVQSEAIIESTTPQSFQHVEYSTKDDFDKNIHADEILNEVISRFSSFLKDVHVKDEYVSVQKVEYVAEKICMNILCAANEFDISNHDDYVTISATIIVKNVASERLNVSELRRLVDLLTGMVSTNTDLNQDTYGSSCKPCFNRSPSKVQYCISQTHLVQEDSAPITTHCETNFEKSAYEIYSSYAPKRESLPLSAAVVEEDRRSKESSLTVVYEADELQHKPVRKPTKYLVRSSYINLLESKGVKTTLCTKCIETTSFWTNYAKQYNEETTPLGSAENVSDDDDDADVSEILPSKRNNNFDSNRSILIMDSESRTIAHDRNVDDTSISNSMMVLFSLASLKGKKLPNVADPYIERDPNEVQRDFIQAVSRCENHDRKKATWIQKCNRCVKRSSINRRRTQSVNDSTSDDNFFTIRDECDRSLLDILKSDLEEPRPHKATKKRVYGKISDNDKKLVEAGCPPTFDSAQIYRTGHRLAEERIVKKSVGVVTQEGTTDKGNQTQ